MTYRQATEKDQPQILELCKKNHLRFPQEAAALLVAVDDLDRVHGVVALQVRLQIEPIIRANSLTGYKLHQAIEEVARTNGRGKLLLALVDSKKTKLLEAMQGLGYEITDTNFTILEKEL